MGLLSIRLRLVEGAYYHAARRRLIGDWGNGLLLPLGVVREIDIGSKCKLLA